MTNKGTVVMVDVYAPTMRLAAAFIKAGYACVRVQSTLEVPPVYRSSFSLDQFADNIVHHGDLAATVSAVAAHAPVAVITGGELGVELADRISEALGLPSNGSALSEARRNKYVQIETLKAAGLRGARQLLVTGESELADWHREIGGRVVVKPIRSAGNDGVSFCDTPAESVAAYRDIKDRTNIFANRNEGVVAQEYLAGGEYVVNTVSRDGHHRATDLWKYTKMSANGVRDRISGALLVPSDSLAREQLEPYAFGVLDALGVRHGPAHLEVMLTPDGPCLVEVGVRLCGADTAYYAEVSAGESQIDWTVDAYVDPDRFLAGYRTPYRVERHVALAFLTSPVAGVLRSYPLLGEVEQLESFHDLHMTVKPGDRLPLTVDDSSEPMMVSLAHPVEEVVARDFGTLCYLDGRGFYDLEPDGGAS
ncbi:ATP-grasp domain-containing protein [Kitasatospora sp. MAP5-34]|uniref:ATP-grasp domain-containing protein n=1 Tax=Kitasatospora sp. MAP5-34 TaxID=3035102 RepID=UPI0024745F00|nr:ATP-grasp domain-containing protein [Kitasatospora sp. MAP5-34]MDH6574463.1 biotin carboxylase [Kitasatospora sp. MAP5-34]